MRILIFGITLIVTFTFLSMEAFAQRRSSYSSTTSSSSSSSGLFGPQHEVSLSTTFGQYVSVSGNSSMSLNGNYRRFIKEGMQVGGRVDLTMMSVNNSSYTFMGLWGTFTYNLHSYDLPNTIYFTGALGLVDEGMASSAAWGNSEKKVSWAAYAGKRFLWMDKIYYTPEAGFRKIGSTDMALVLIPLNVSVLW